MNLSLVLVLTVLSQERLPPPVQAVPPPPYFTELVDYAGMTNVAGNVDGPRLFSAQLKNPGWIASRAGGLAFVVTDGAAPGTSALRFIVQSGVYTYTPILPFAQGDVGGVATDPVTGEVLITDTRRHLIFKIATFGATPTVFAGSSTQVSCFVLNAPCFVGGSANGNGTLAQFSAPGGIAVDSSRQIWVADLGNRAIRKITSAGDVSTLTLSAAPADFEPKNLVLDEVRSRLLVTSRNAVYAVSFSGQVAHIAGVPGNSGLGAAMLDGEASVARFASPAGLAVDDAGNIFVADSEQVPMINPFRIVSRGAIRQISPGVSVRNPFASYPTSVATLSLAPGLVDRNGYTFWSDATLEQPRGLAWVGSVLAVTDTQRHTVRLIR